MEAIMMEAIVRIVFKKKGASLGKNMKGKSNW